AGQGVDSSLAARSRAGAARWARRDEGESRMVFSSITFLFYFLPIFLACYVLTPTVVGKNVVTLLFSLVFYAWGEPRFLLILLFSIAFNYVAAILIDR